MRSEPSLYQRLADFALDDERASFKFSDRLARENGWSLTFAKQAIDEYKKFVYLAATSPTPVTPSDIVDQVWHLHLTFSRSYWNEMCGEILRKPLHHGPTLGGASEDAKYRDLYAATLDAYRREFGEAPPAAFWPASDARFESAAHQRWIDTRTHAVIAWRTIARTIAFTASATALASAGAAFAASNASTGDNGMWTAFAIGIGVFLALVMLGLAAGRGGAPRRQRGNTDDGSGAMPWIWGVGGGGGSHGKSHGGEAGGEHGGESGGGDGGGSGCSSGCSGGGGCSGSS